MIKCPCIECICLAICRNKGYLRLVNGCELVNSYLCTPCNASEERNYPLKVLYNLLKPTRWYLEKGKSEFHLYNDKVIMVRPTND